MAAPWRGWVISIIAVDGEYLFGLLIVRLDILVAVWPGRRKAFCMDQVFKITLTETDQRCTVKFGAATNVVIDAWTELFALGIKPAIMCSVFFSRRKLRKRSSYPAHEAPSHRAPG
ncbi:hypothetical protein PPS11_02034 [Pseudomonas putida S11]|nr:hypothetical protein PPS11_02034 [Pseudomonas putida S11]